MLRVTGYITAQVGQLGLIGNKTNPINITHKQFKKNFDFNNPVGPLYEIIVEYLKYCGDDGVKALHDLRGLVDELVNQNPLKPDIANSNESS